MTPDRLARLHAATDAGMGQTVRIVPKAAGGYLTGAADPDRSPATVVGFVTLVPHSVRTAGSAANSGHNTQLRSSSRTVKFATSAISYPVAGGDHVVLADGTEHRVNGVYPYGSDRTVLMVEPITP